MVNEYWYSKAMRRWDVHLKLLTFLDVCPLEFGKGVLSVLDMSRGGTLEILFDPLSCAILRFLLGGLEIKDTQSSEKYFAHLECGKRVNDVNRERVQESLSGLSFYKRI
jgi:hypothetical protein